MVTGVSFSPEPAASPEDDTVAGASFWPSIDVNHFRDTMRIGGTTIPNTRLKEALLQAQLDVDYDLTAWLVLQEEASYATLAEVPSQAVGAETWHTVTWRRAVYARAAADLSETHADLTATPQGASRGQETFLTAGDFRRNATQAIRALQGKRRTRGSLI